MASLIDFLSNLPGSSGSFFSGSVICTEPKDSPGSGDGPQVRLRLCKLQLVSVTTHQDNLLVPRPSSLAPAQLLPQSTSYPLGGSMTLPAPPASPPGDGNFHY